MAANMGNNTLIGKPQSRIDGPVKVSGQARYTSDYSFPGMLYAVPVGATVARGKLLSLDTKVAEAMPGVRAVFHGGNIGRLYRASFLMADLVLLDEKRPPLADNDVNYFGQYIAVVVADTFEQATAAADAVEARYAAERPVMNFDLLRGTELKQSDHRGDAVKAFESAAVKIDQVYSTPVQTHNAIELHGTVAVWEGGNCTLYDTVQGVGNHQLVMTQRLGIEREQLRVITRYLGSGFGGKISAWGHCCLAAAAARNLNRPVKLVLSRRQAFESAGHRPATQQRVRLGATAEGKLVSLQHDYVNTTAMVEDFTEYCAEASPFLYSTANMSSSSALARRTLGAATSMRGPGAVPGSFALESAMDELAYQLRIDPVALRHRNEPALDESMGIPFSSRHLTEALNMGAERFGWSQRSSEVGSMKRDGLTLGWGVAVAAWGAGRFASSAAVDLRADGTARVSCGTQDIGTGTYTILAQLVGERLGLAMDKVEVAIGDSNLPAGPLSGGSLVTSSLVPAVSRALDEVSQRLITAASLLPDVRWSQTKPEDLQVVKGRLVVKANPSGPALSFSEVLQQTGVRSLTGTGSSDGTILEKPKLSKHCFSAQFAEVTWQPEMARLRVSRVVTVIDSGRIINPKAGRNQIVGAVVMGVGMALFEGTEYDPRKGVALNTNLADYVMTTHADTPDIDVIFLDYPDFEVNELGAKGIGEIGMAGVAGAIANATYHATGVRVRQLPIRIEALLEQNQTGRELKKEPWPTHPTTKTTPQPHRANDSPDAPS